MKNLTRIILATLLGSTLACGLDATKVKVKLDKPAPLKMQRINPPNSNNFFAASAEKRNARQGLNPNGWHYVSIPMNVVAEGVKGSEPDFIPEMTVDVYLLISVRTSERPMLLKKTITYVDIPIFEGKGVFNVGAFLKPSDVSKLTVSKGKEDKSGTGDMAHSLAGYAVVARFDGKLCNILDPKEPSDHVFSTEFKSKLTGKWWESSKLSAPAGIKLYAINETPFADFYSPTFPKMKVLRAGAGADEATAPVERDFSTSPDEFTSDDDSSGKSSRSSRSSRSTTSRSSRSSRTSAGDDE